MKEKYKVCTNCNKIHIMHHTFKDKTANCYFCGGAFFKDFNGNLNEAIEDQKNFTPIFCDWQQQFIIDKSSEDLVEYLEQKNKIQLDSKFKDDLKSYFVMAANSNRTNFINSVEALTKGERSI